ncbi:sugar kinase [Actinomadura parmotrematis]|uniref:Sugar kinase n=1 Tax=Actinomadura parmotrematis TaxID=2864039 RepID=A0ABS7G521_9ACTN|nr:sugar kinase [Actinomadura parmotrematis]MBW8486728.1 sugar kinase [Actinomadura parmotrematis]
MTVDVFTLGEAMVCFAPAAGLLDAADDYRCSVGGAELNTAVGLARLGRNVRWTSRLSADPLGDRIAAVLRAENVGAAPLPRAAGRPTGLMLKDRPGGEARVLYYRRGSAAALLAPEDIDEDAVRSARLVHVTGITPALGPGPAAAVRRVLAVAREASVPVSFDPNFRPQLWDAAEAAAAYRDLLPSVDQLLCNEAEARLITGRPEAAEALEALAATGPGTVVVKRSGDGVLASCAGRLLHAPAWTVTDPVDTVGAGDAFNAGWLHAWLEGMDAGLGLRLAAFVAAQVVRHPGDYEGFPDAAAVSAWLAAHGGPSTDHLPDTTEATA